MFVERECVIVTRLSYWITYNCYHQLPYVCQSQMITINACFWLCDCIHYRYGKVYVICLISTIFGIRTLKFQICTNDETKKSEDEK